VEPVREELIRQVEGFAANPPTAEEMERARINFANSAERMMNDHENIGLALSEYIALGDWRLFFLDRDRSQTVTAEQVTTAVSKYMRRDNRVVGMFLHEENPQRAEIPQAASAEELLKDFKPRQALAAAEAFDPSPENIERRVKRLEIGGVKVALLSKKTRGEAVHFRLSLQAGDEKSLAGQSYAGIHADARHHAPFARAAAR
jgi:zinc protease